MPKLASVKRFVPNGFSVLGRACGYHVQPTLSLQQMSDTRSNPHCISEYQFLFVARLGGVEGAIAITPKSSRHRAFFWLYQAIDAYWQFRTHIQDCLY